MEKLKSKLIIAVMVIFVITAFMSCDNNGLKEEINYENPFMNNILLIQDGVSSELTESVFFENMYNRVSETKNIGDFVETKLKKQDDGTFILIAINKEGNVKIATVLEFNNGHFVYSPNSSTCKCTGCTNGCDPKHISGNSWSCTSCELPSSNTTCEKEVTATAATENPKE